MALSETELCPQLPSLGTFCTPQEPGFKRFQECSEPEQGVELDARVKSSW
jgi:hypothetical protein